MNSQEQLLLQRRYDSLRFRRNYTYSGRDLGVRCDGSRTEFALWSPLARRVTLLLFESPCTDRVLREQPMQKARRGVWRYRTAENLHGIFYEYRIDFGSGFQKASDPYAICCGCSSGRAMAADLRTTDPEGWDQDTAPDREPEDIIWETHVKEFSWDPDGGFPEAFRGKYLAFTCPDTHLAGHPEFPTGLAHLKRLGVNTVQLMPVFDFGSVEETDPRQFNWGYDPVYYNIPEGSYALDPQDPLSRIRECKQMIQSLHRQGFRVIMDVVYNHTYSLDSPFSQTVPGYYYRHDGQGHPCNGSFCGNEVASQRPMCGKFILDSLLYWAEEYHMDGFRFDLMGLLDVDLMNRIQTALDRKFGVGEKLIYGEPWAGTSPALSRKNPPASKQNMGRLNPRIAMFCDNTRDSVKGHIFFSAQPGFVSGAENLEHSMLMAQRAWCGDLPGIHAPSQILTYLSCHDNLTLFDKLTASGPRDRSLSAMYRLCAAILMTCQGHIFLLSGEEFARTKEGNDNSYNAPISLNRLDWNRAREFRELTDYYRGLIGLRKLCPALCDKSTAHRELFHWFQPHALGICLDNSSSGRSGQLYLIYNADTAPVTHSLPAGSWQLCANGDNSFLWQEEHTVSDSVTVPAVSALILWKEEA